LREHQSQVLQVSADIAHARWALHEQVGYGNSITDGFPIFWRTALSTLPLETAQRWLTDEMLTFWKQSLKTICSILKIR
jgi:hypothetical protein